MEFGVTEIILLSIAGVSVVTGLSFAIYVIYYMIKDHRYAIRDALPC